MYFRVLPKLRFNKRNGEGREVTAVRVWGHVTATYAFLHNYVLDPSWYQHSPRRGYTWQQGPGKEARMLHDDTLVSL